MQALRFCLFLLMCIVLFGCQTNGSEQPQPPIVVKPLTLEQYCETNTCREDIDILVATAEGEYTLTQLQYWPVVYQGDITVLPGERLYIEADIDDENNITELRAVEENEHPERTFELFFAQIRGSYGMFFSVRNPLESPVHFDFELTDVNGREFRVGSCPVRSNRSFLERWAEPAMQITLSNPRILEPTADIVCSG
ncbi:hypothetical protein A28LD_1042 [Idiomarina sp. A28L]|uniref:hypothetical protein n=1 Tax=Idiomarina sp. A28L TaxID=1036674 RepID=UPI0002138C2B|nr:hypothetical protein [Idiomarina sp. A28L]EGN75429.1 hypothetical protein A28LD_1042 [Idiomarina sp. A28L]